MGLDVDAAGEIIVGYSHLVLPPVTAAWPMSTRPGKYEHADTNARAGRTTRVQLIRSRVPMSSPSPAPPLGNRPGDRRHVRLSAEPHVDLSGRSKLWRPVLLRLYADPNLVNGNVRLVGYQSTSSNPSCFRHRNRQRRSSHRAAAAISRPASPRYRAERTASPRPYPGRRSSFHHRSRSIKCGIHSRTRRSPLRA